MKKKLLFVFIVVLLLEILFGYFYVCYLRNKTIKVVSVPIAAHKIESRSCITEEDITYIEINEKYLVEDVLINKEDIIGKYTDIYTSVPEGSLFYEESLFDLSELPDNPHLLLKDNQVSFSLVTDLNKLSGNTITSGIHVDVYVSIARRNDKPIFDLLLSNVRVLAIKDRKGYDIDDVKGTRIPYICILAVDEKSLNLLSNAVKVGDVEIYVTSDSYNSGNESIINTKSLVLEYLK